MALSTEQILLLENLVYTYSSKFPYNSLRNYEGGTVGDYINSIDVEALAEYGTTTSYTTGEDWANIINAIRNDSTLMNMTIATTHVDGDVSEGGGFSAVFLDNTTNEAVVAFKGTESDAEWQDNFAGGTATDMPDGVSTQHQVNALEWYQSTYEELGLEDYHITVTGHSKGGNKAKYITIMDDTVDSCISFDGQGFSDQFCEKYKDRIALRQDLIENHNVNYDYVNILVNDVGARYYYTGYGIGSDGGGFLENHCPNSYFYFDENGNPVMTLAPDGQGYGMEILDEYLNSMLRSLPEEDQRKALQLIYEIKQNGKGKDYLIELLTSSEYKAIAAYLIAYTIEYIERYPELETVLVDFLDYYGLSDLKDIVTTAVKVVQSEYFDYILDGVISVASSSVGIKVIQWIVEQLDIDLSAEQVRKILETLEMVPEYQGKITEIPDGSDIVIEGLDPAVFQVVTTVFEAVETAMATCVKELGELVDRIGACKLDHTLGIMFNTLISRRAEKLQSEVETLQELKNVLPEIKDKYEETELKIIQHAS